MTTVTAIGTLTVNPSLGIALTINPTTINVGQSVTFTATVTGGTGPFTYTWSGLPSPCSGNSDTITCSPNTAGTYNVTITVKDATGAIMATSGVLTVNPVTPLSIILAISPTTINVGQSVTFVATVTGGIAPYTYGWSGLPGGCTGGNINTFTCSPNTTGIYNITVTVTDSS